MRKEAMLYEKSTGGKVHCLLCSHRCEIADSKYGKCGVRKNEKGRLYTLVYGEVIASHVDPIEKKPFYHFLPGSRSYSIATIGCNFRCGFCQNWSISQASKRVGGSASYELKPEEVVREAKKTGSRSISYTYTEPTIFFEYAYDTAKRAKKEGLYNTFVTNGYMTREALLAIKPYLDACNVDLKSFREETYRDICAASLKPVLDSIRYMKELGIWVEVTTLVVPGLNDTEDELKRIAEFIASVDKGIPWHISRFHPDYKFTDTAPTPRDKLKIAESAGKNASLKYIYLGNIIEEGATSCHKCGKLLIVRTGYFIKENNVKHGKCPDCNSVVEGVWE